MKYFIWHEGEEHGPYEFDQLLESWKEGTLPQGFLWRRETSTQFSMPEALEAESKALGQPIPPVVEAKSDLKHTSKKQEAFQLDVPTSASVVAYLFIIGGFFFIFRSIQAGSALITIGFIILFGGWCAAVLNGFSILIGRLDRISRQLEQRDRP